MDPQADEAHFVGYDDELKGFRIYWPKKQQVSIERDVYTDRDWALQPDEVLIEVVEDVFTKYDTSQAPDNSDSSSTPTEDTPKDPEPESIDNMGKNLPEMPSVSPETLQTPSNTPIAPPHQRTMQQNSLTGLTPVDEVQYGRGKRNWVATSHSTANMIEDALVVDDDRHLEPGGVELNMSEEEWFIEAMCYTLC